MFIGDSRRGDGPGYLPLRHRNYESQPTSLDMRACVLGLEIANRDEGGGFSQGMGFYQFSEGSLGDIIGGGLWGVSQKRNRELPAWRFSWPSRAKIKPPVAEQLEDPPFFGVDDFEIGLPGIDAGAWNNLPGVIPFVRGQAPLRLLPGPAPAGGDGGGAMLEGEGGGARVEAMACPVAPEPNFLPIFDGAWSQDERFDEKRVTTTPMTANAEGDPMRWFPKVPDGFSGLVMNTDTEASQEDIWMQTDPRLITMNVESDPEFGTLIYDMKPVPDAPAPALRNPRVILVGADGEAGADPDELNYEVDATRRAPLQGLIRIHPGPFGGACADMVPGPPNYGIIALQLGLSNCEEVRGGFMFDQEADEGEGVGGCLQSRHEGRGFGGPFEVGRVFDVHRLFTDADGHSWNPMHISLEAFYCPPGGGGADGTFDAPLKWEEEFDQDAAYAETWRECKFAWRGKPEKHVHPCTGEDIAGIHKWWAGCVAEYGSEVPGDLFTSPGEGGGASLAFPDGCDDDDRFRQFNQIYGELALPGILARPQLHDLNAADMRNWCGPHANPGIDREPYRLEMRTLTPLVARLEAYGAQHDGAWKYTHQPGAGGRYGPTGTAAGGWALLPPETSLLQAQGDDQPATVSKSYLTLAPNVRLGFGRPDTSTGELKSGLSLEVDGTNNAILGYTDAGGTRTQVFELAQDLQTVTAGKGFVAKTPDGTKSYRIAVDNSGGVTTTLI